MCRHRKNAGRSAPSQTFCDRSEVEVADRYPFLQIGQLRSKIDAPPKRNSPAAARDRQQSDPGRGACTTRTATISRDGHHRRTDTGGESRFTCTAGSHGVKKQYLRADPAMACARCCPTRARWCTNAYAAKPLQFGPRGGAVGRRAARVEAGEKREEVEACSSCIRKADFVIVTTGIAGERTPPGGPDWFEEGDRSSRALRFRARMLVGAPVKTAPRPGENARK